MLSVHPMSLPEVRQDWGWVRNGLLEVIGRCSERWSPEDVWTSVMGGQSFLWRIERAGDDIGFLVLRRLDDPDGPVLFVWAAWAEPGSLTKHAKDLFDRLVELAHRMGAKRLRMESPRKGWAEWFEQHSIIWEFEV